MSSKSRKATSGSGGIQFEDLDGPRVLHPESSPNKTRFPLVFKVESPCDWQGKIFLFGRRLDVPGSRNKVVQGIDQYGKSINFMDHQVEILYDDPLS